MAQVHDDRRDDGRGQTLLDAEGDDRHRREDGEHEFAEPGRSQPSQPPQVHQIDTDDEDHGGQDGQRQMAERAGDREQDEEHHHAGRQLRQLGAPARPVHHLRLGGAAVHHERPAESGDDIGAGQREQVLILVELFVVLRGIRPGRRRTLRENDEEYGDGGTEKRADVVDSEGRGGEGRQAARHVTEHPNAVLIEMQASGSARSRPRRR